MPQKPKRPCSHPGCPKLTHGRYCEEHQKIINSNYDKARRPLKKKRYGRNWKHIRDLFIKEHPLCEECFKHNKLTPAEEVHHIRPLSKGGTHDTDNLMALCKSCHSKITAKYDGGWGNK